MTARLPRRHLVLVMESIAKKHECTLEWGNTRASGTFHVCRRVILLEGSWNILTRRLVGTFCHEVGHAQQWLRFNKCSPCFYNNYWDKPVKYEVEACQIGEILYNRYFSHILGSNGTCVGIRAEDLERLRRNQYYFLRTEFRRARTDAYPCGNGIYHEQEKDK